MKIAENFRLAVRELGIKHAGSEKGIVTVSVGVGVKSPGDEIRGPADLLKLSDQVRYRAKDAGRDCARCPSSNDLRPLGCERDDHITVSNRSGLL